MDQYEENLQGNLQDLETRLHRQSYRPQPSLRRDIPKGNGKTRPLGIACVEDKIVQRAVVMILERIYEVDFCDTSCGFRPGRSCHQALSALGQIIATRRVHWVSDADIKGFFDHVSHPQLVELLRHGLLTREWAAADRTISARGCDDRRLSPRNGRRSRPGLGSLRHCWRTCIRMTYWATGSNVM